MQSITIKHVRTWHYRKMRRYREQFSDAGPLSLRRFCPGCIISTGGYDFRKGQGYFGKFLASETAKWEKVVHAANLSIE